MIKKHYDEDLEEEIKRAEILEVATQPCDKELYRILKVNIKNLFYISNPFIR